MPIVRRSGKRLRLITGVRLAESRDPCSGGSLLPRRNRTIRAMTDRPITLFHSPNTRSSGALFLLEELGAPYALHVIDRAKNEHLAPDFLAINPLGKVPALLDGDAVVTEQVAIFLHLADRFPAAGLAPEIDDPMRGPYLRWMVFYAASFEPAVVDHALKRDPGSRAMSPYGSYDAVIDTLAAELRRGPYLLGERFTAADVLWGMALSWTLAFKVVPDRPELVDYARRINERPAAIRMRAKDAALAGSQQA